MSYIPVYQLNIYCLAEDLSDIVWKAYDQWNNKARLTLGIQLIRAANSIAANLAEGYGRFSAADRKRFYIIARGSLEETKARLRKA
ncbi:four helix bundle protein [Taibaiella helva]|uniref:four helix bundle protein n=1 Tax=Taibaiella helva TaxID=2301235 RepID=UPI000E58BF3D